jgi:hypothetical protein
MMGDTLRARKSIRGRTAVELSTLEQYRKLNAGSIYINWDCSSFVRTRLEGPPRLPSPGMTGEALSAHFHFSFCSAEATPWKLSTTYWPRTGKNLNALLKVSKDPLQERCARLTAHCHQSQGKGSSSRDDSRR